MKITLINPGPLSDAGEDQFAGRMDAVFFRLSPFSKTYFGIPLALPTLAGATPSKHSVRIIDEMVETIDFDAPCDVVGISAMTCKATRGYQIAAEFRKRGVPVVMGGIHASMCPDEVAAHVDCVVVGEADAIWAELLRDLEQGRLKPRYAGALPDAASIALPRHDLTPHKHYFAYLLQTTRGCPRDCSFCTVTAMNGRTLRKKTPEQVIAEVRSVLRIPNQVRPVIFDIEASKRERRLASGTIFFVDDNFAIDRQHALSICQALKGFHWVLLGLRGTGSEADNYATRTRQALVVGAQADHCRREPHRNGAGCESRQLLHVQSWRATAIRETFNRTVHRACLCDNACTCRTPWEL